MIISADDFKIDRQDGTWLCVRLTGSLAQVTQFVLEHNGKGQKFDVEVKKHYNKRSKEANRYLWVLLSEMSVSTGRKKEDIYLDYVRDFGPCKQFNLTEDEAKTFRVAWSRLGTGWPTEQVDYTPDGERVVINAYYGSSTYNTRQMSRLLDLVIDDCKALGIETLPPDKLAALKEEWGRA